MQVELGQLELRYEALRIRDVAAEGRLLASLSEHGQKSPVLVALAREPRYVLIDGYRRIRALRRLGHDLAQAMVLPGTEADALMLGHRMETGRRSHALEEGWLLRALCEEHGMKQPELSERLLRSGSWVSRRMGLVRVLPSLVQERVRDGTVNAHAAMKSLLPLARANRGHCETLIERVGTARLSSRQYARLYTAWKRGDEERKRRIVEEPLLFLKADEAAFGKDDKKDKTPGQLLASDLEALAGLCWRAHKRVHEALPRGATVEGDGFQARAAWERAQIAFRALGKRIEERIDAGLRHESSDSAVT